MSFVILHLSFDSLFIIRPFAFVLCPSSVFRRPSSVLSMTKRSINLSLSLLRDVILANAAFVLGYYVRYNLQLFRPVLDANKAPYQAYLSFQLGYVALLL